MTIEEFRKLVNGNKEFGETLLAIVNHAEKIAKTHLSNEYMTKLELWIRNNGK